jgi:hypothetical protein
MDGLDLYRRIEYPNETRASWAVERDIEERTPVSLRHLTAKEAERLAD